MFSAQFYHLPDGKTEASREVLSASGEPGLECRFLCSTVGVVGPSQAVNPPIRAPSPEGDASLPNPTVNIRLLRAGPQVFCWPN